MGRSLLSHDHTLAQDRVARAREVVVRQHLLIGEIRARDGDCADAKQLLGTFERVLAAFEDELRQFE